jgi:FdhD protein
MGRVTSRTRIIRIGDTGVEARPDTVVVEEPIEIRIQGTPLAVTIRTLGSDVKLTQNFLLTEGIIGDQGDVASARYCTSAGPDGTNTYNVLDVRLAADVQMPAIGIERNLYTTSSCGVCGKASLEATAQHTRHSPAGDAGAVARPVARGAEDLRQHRWAARSRPLRRQR